MLEVTLRRKDGLGPLTFKFENDELQVYIANEAAEGRACEVIGLTALGVAIAQPAAKTAGPGAPRTQAPGITTPIKEQARESGTLRQPVGVKPADVATKPAKPETK